jgi:hypothetical protein
MKNTVKHLGTIILITVIAFSMAACPTGSGSSGGGGGQIGGEYLGSSLTISNQQVYNHKKLGEAWTEYTGNKTVISMGRFDQLGTGTITNGKFSFKAGVPPNNELILLEDTRYIGSYRIFDITDPSNFFISSSPSDTRAVVLRILRFSSDDGSLLKIDSNFNNLAGSTTEEVIYIYVDRDCTITGPERIESAEVFKKYNISLKKGWNVMNSKEVTDRRDHLHINTYELKAGDLSNCRWRISVY